MDNVFIVIAECESEPAYGGVETASYFCGIYKTEEDASQRVKVLEDNLKDFKTDLDRYAQKSNGKYDRNLAEAFFEKYDELLDLHVELQHPTDPWSVKYNIIEQPIGDVTMCCIRYDVYD